MFLVYDVEDVFSKVKKKIFIDLNAIPEVSRESIQEEFSQQGVIVSNSMINFNLGDTIKELIRSTAMNDDDILDLAKIFLKAKRAGMDTLRLNNLLANNKNPKIRKVGRFIVENPQYALDTIEYFRMPKYAKEVFTRINRTDNESAKMILNTLIDILVLKRDTKKVLVKLLRYPKILYFLITSAFLIFMFFMIPNMKEITQSMDIKDIPALSEWVYGLTEQAQEDKWSFIFKVYLLSFVSYKIFYKIISLIARRIPFLYKISFYKDHALFFGLLATMQAAGISSILSFSGAVDVIEDGKNRNKMKAIVYDMMTHAIDFADALKKYNYSKEILEHIVANKGLNDIETYTEIKDDYTEEMKSRVEAASSYVTPASLVFVMLTLGVLVYAAFAPIMSLFDKVSSM